MKEYPIRADGDFSVHGDQPVEKVKRILDSVDPRAIERAGNAYLDAASMLGTAQRAIEDASKAMADVWGDKASVKAQEVFQRLHGAIDTLGQKANWMGRPLQSLGKTVIPPFKNDLGDNLWGQLSWTEGPSWTHGIPDLAVDTKDGWDWFTSDNSAAKEHLKKFNNELYSWHNLLPDSVTEDLPKLSWPTPDQKTYTVPTYPTGDLPDRGNGPNYSPDPNGNLPQNPGPGNVNNPSITGPNATDPNATDPNATDPNATDPNATDPNATDPNATDPSGNGPGNTDVNGNIPGTNQPGLDPASMNTDGTNGSANPNGTDPRSTGLSDYQPPKLDTSPISTIGPNSSTSPTTYLPAGNPSATGVPGGGTVPGTGTNVGTNFPMNMNGSTTLRAGGNTTGTNGMGMPFMPMGGMGAGGGEERTSESSTWLVEDDDVWGGPAKEVVDDTIR